MKTVEWLARNVCLFYDWKQFYFFVIVYGRARAFVSYSHVKSELFMRAMIYFNRNYFICNKVPAFFVLVRSPSPLPLPLCTFWMVLLLFICFRLGFIVVIKFEWLLAESYLLKQTPFITFASHRNTIHFLILTLTFCVLAKVALFPFSVAFFVLVFVGSFLVMNCFLYLHFFVEQKLIVIN